MPKPHSKPHVSRDPCGSPRWVPNHIFKAQSNDSIPRGTGTLQPLVVFQVLNPVETVLLTVILDNQLSILIDEIESADESDLVKDLLLQHEESVEPICGEE